MQERIYPPTKLYEMCKIARDILKDKHGVARVIARPFIKEDGKMIRTSNRRDFSLTPPTPNLLTKFRRKAPCFSYGDIRRLLFC